MRSEFDVPADMLIQFDAKGSYRHGTVEAFLKWVLPLETNPADSFVVNLDWFAAHLCPEVQRLIENLGHVRLMIPGGITPDVQVPDTHLNQPLNREYQNLEIRDSNLELATRADSVPSTSRQTVATRIYEAWQRSQASNEESAWIQNGIMNNLDGGEDHLLRSDLQQLWFAEQMPAWRVQCILEIEAEVEAKRLVSWDQYEDVLEPYEAHEPIPEGLDAGVVGVVADEALAHHCGSDHEGGGSDSNDEGVLTESEEGEKAMDIDDDDGVELSGRVCISAIDQLPVGVVAQATAALDQEESEDRLKALLECSKRLRAAGEHIAAGECDRRLAVLLKNKKGKTIKEVQLFVRAQMITRKMQDEELRQDDYKRKHDLKLAQLALRKAKIDADGAQALSRKELARAKATEATAKENRDSKKSILANLKDAEAHRRLYFASELAKTLREYFADVEFAEARRSAFKQACEDAAKAKRYRRCREVPKMWSDTSTKGYVPVHPNSGPGLAKIAKKDQGFASEALSFEYFGGKKKAELKNARSVESRFRDLLAKCMPFYDAGLRLGHPQEALLKKYQNNVDLAFLAAAWLYSDILGMELFPVGLHVWPPSTMPSGASFPVGRGASFSVGASSSSAGGTTDAATLVGDVSCPVVAAASSGGVLMDKWSEAP